MNACLSCLLSSESNATVCGIPASTMYTGLCRSLKSGTSHALHALHRLQGNGGPRKQRLLCWALKAPEQVPFTGLLPGLRGQPLCNVAHVPACMHNRTRRGSEAGEQ